MNVPLRLSAPLLVTMHTSWQKCAMHGPTHENTPDRSRQAEAPPSSTLLSQLPLQNGPDPRLVHFLDGPTVAVAPASHTFQGVGPSTQVAAEASSGGGSSSSGSGGSGGGDPGRSVKCVVWGGALDRLERAYRRVLPSLLKVSLCRRWRQQASAGGASSVRPQVGARRAYGRTRVVHASGWAEAHGGSPRPVPRGSPSRWRRRPASLPCARRQEAA